MISVALSDSESGSNLSYLNTPKNGDVTNIVWNVVDNSLSTTTFKKSAMRYRFGQTIVLTLCLISQRK